MRRERFQKNPPHPILREPLKLQRHLVQLLDIWETNCQRAHENWPRRRERWLLSVSFFKGWTGVSILFLEQPEYSHWSQHKLQASLHGFQYRGVFIAPLPISRSIHCAIVNHRGEFIAPLPTENNNILCYSSRHWKQIPNLFIAPLPTTMINRLLFPNCIQLYEVAWSL